MLQFRLGEGLVTAVNDIEFAENWQIGRNDNAEFLWRLLQRTPALEAVAIYRGRRRRWALALDARRAGARRARAAGAGAAVARACPGSGPCSPTRARPPAHARPPERERAVPVVVRAPQHAAARGRAPRHGRGRAPLPARRADAGAEQAAFLHARFGLAPALAQQLASASFPDRRAPAMIQLARACAEIHQRIAHQRRINDSRPLPNR
jgi:hypothetical protein